MIATTVTLATARAQTAGLKGLVLGGQVRAVLSVKTEFYLGTSEQVDGCTHPPTRKPPACFWAAPGPLSFALRHQWG